MSKEDRFEGKEDALLEQRRTVLSERETLSRNTPFHNSFGIPPCRTMQAGIATRFSLRILGWTELLSIW